MKSIVLMDTARLREVTFSRNFWMSGEKLEWDRGDHTFKFVVLQDETLVIGPISEHKSLYAVHQTLELPIAEAKERVAELEDADYPRFGGPVIAAGMVSVDGQITGWKSDGFRIETPEAMRVEIEREIKELFQSDLLVLS